MCVFFMFVGLVAKPEDINPIVICVFLLLLVGLVARPGDTNSIENRVLILFLFGLMANPETQILLKFVSPSCFLLA
jgi:hypothetical protein